MNVRFVSSLTPEDEARIAPILLSALGAILDQLPIAYTLRIETADERVFQHSHAGLELLRQPVERTGAASAGASSRASRL